MKYLILAIITIFILTCSSPNAKVEVNSKCADTCWVYGDKVYIDETGQQVTLGRPASVINGYYKNGYFYVSYTDSVNQLVIKVKHITQLSYCKD